MELSKAGYWKRRSVPRDKSFYEHCSVIILLVHLGLFWGHFGYGQKTTSEDILLLFTDTDSDKCGYKNLHGDTVIPLGKYSICYTDTFRTYAIVALVQKGFVGIDRKQNILYNVFPFDNGPDEAKEGLFRIMVGNKIGYADAATGKVVIQPEFACAWPFENGKAKVTLTCETKPMGEHRIWLSNSWFYVDKQGRKVKP